MITARKFAELDAKYPNLTDREFEQHAAYADRQDRAMRRRELQRELRESIALEKHARRVYDAP